MSKNKSMFYALFVMLLWGTLFPMVKLSYGAYNVSTVGDILLFAGVRFTVCILKQIGALFYVCFSFLFFKDDKLTIRKLAGALVGFAGIVAINTDSDGISFGIGDALIVAASFCTVFSNVISKKVFQNVKPVTSTGISQLFGGLILLVVGKIIGGSVSFHPDASIFIMVYICIASVFSYCIWYYIVKNGELSKLFIIKFAEPMFACVFGALILGENVFNLQYIIAFVLISLGIFISNNSLQFVPKNDTILL